MWRYFRNWRWDINPGIIRFFKDVWINNFLKKYPNEFIKNFDVIQSRYCMGLNKYTLK